MEIKLLDGDIVLKQEVLNEIEDKIKYEVEWYYEQTGEIADSQDVFEKVTKDMETKVGCLTLAICFSKNQKRISMIS
jgi:hypothetical protein